MRVRKLMLFAAVVTRRCLMGLHTAIMNGAAFCWNEEHRSRDQKRYRSHPCGSLSRATRAENGVAARRQWRCLRWVGVRAPCHGTWLAYLRVRYGGREGGRDGNERASSTRSVL